MSPELKQFLKDWYKWATTGADEDHFEFSRSCGLCSQSLIRGQQVSEELQEIFREEFPHTSWLGNYYPFGGTDTYNMDSFENRMHLNPRRLLWVKGKIS